MPVHFYGTVAKRPKEEEKLFHSARRFAPTCPFVTDYTQSVVLQPDFIAENDPAHRNYKRVKEVEIGSANDSDCSFERPVFPMFERNDRAQGLEGSRFMTVSEVKVLPSS